MTAETVIDNDPSEVGSVDIVNSWGGGFVDNFERKTSFLRLVNVGEDFGDPNGDLKPSVISAALSLATKNGELVWEKNQGDKEGISFKIDRERRVLYVTASEEVATGLSDSRRRIRQSIVETGIEIYRQLRNMDKLQM